MPSAATMMSELANRVSISSGANALAEIEFDSHRHAAPAQNIEQPHPRNAAEAIAGAAHLLAAIMNGDIVPIGKAVAQLLVGLHIMGHELVERLVGKDDAESERVAMAVLLENLDCPGGICFLRQEERNTSRPVRRR